MANSTEADVDHLEREVEQTRANVSETLDALQNQVADTVQEWRGRLTVEEISKEVKAYASERVTEMAHTRPALTLAIALGVAWPFYRLARKVPIPLYLIGAGAYMMKPVPHGHGASRSRYDRGYDATGDRGGYDASSDYARGGYSGGGYSTGGGYSGGRRDFGSAGRGQSQSISDYARMASDKVSDIGSQASDLVSGAARRVQSAVSSLTGQSGSTYRRPSSGGGYERSYYEGSYRGASEGGSSRGIADTAMGAAQSAAEAARQAAQSAAGAATGAVRSVADAATGAATGAVDLASSAVDSVSSAAARAASYSRQHAPTNFWILAGLGLAIGATLAVALPETRTESRWIGPTGDRLRARARREANARMRDARETLDRAYHVALEEAEARGLTPEAARDAARDFVSRIGDVTQDAMQGSGTGSQRTGDSSPA